MKLLQKQKNLGVAVILLSTLLGGCELHSINQNPQTQVLGYSSYSVQSDDDIFDKPWWHSFNRPALNEFVEKSLSNNFDVAKAVAVLEQAKAVAKQTSTEKMPLVNLKGNTSKDWEDGDSQRGGSEVGGTLSWELDIWNRIGNAAKADRLEAEARAADVEAVKLSLSAEVAQSYFGAVAAHKKVDLLREQLQLDNDLENILNLRLKGGVGTNVDLLQQQARVADSETLIPVAESELAVFENRLDVLLGEMPDGKMRVIGGDDLRFASELPKIGVPSVLLLNRPDLISARAELVAADSEIAVAIADRLPRVTLNGSYAYQDNSSFTGPVSMIMGSFVQPLLDWGARKAEVERNKALYKEQLAEYTQTYLEAVEEVENALVKETKQREFLNKLESQRKILRKAANAAEQRYKKGVDDYQPVISALQELRVVERNLVNEKLVLLNIRIDLFRAIGGPIYETITQEVSNETI